MQNANWGVSLQQGAAREISDLRKEFFYYSKSTFHQNLPPTSHGLESHIRRVFLTLKYHYVRF